MAVPALRRNFPVARGGGNPRSEKERSHRTSRIVGGTVSAGQLVFRHALIFRGRWVLLSAAWCRSHGGPCGEKVCREPDGGGANGARTDRRWEERQAAHRRLESRPGEGAPQVRSGAARPPLDG